MALVVPWASSHLHVLHLEATYNHESKGHKSTKSLGSPGPWSAVEATIPRLVEFGSVSEDLDPVEWDTEEDLVYRHSFWVICLLICGYLSVLCVGLVGNLSVLVVIPKTPRLSTVTKLFISNLALADLLVLTFCILPTLISNIYTPWVLGCFLCKTVPFMQGASVRASIYSLVAVTVERCVRIQRPLHPQLSMRTARICIILIWIWSSLIAAPWAIFFDLSPVDKQYPDHLFCTEVWPEGYEFDTYYFLFANVVLCYLFPLGVICVCYALIWLSVWRRPPLSCEGQSPNSAIELMHQQAKVGVEKMLVAVTLTFALSWLPLYLIFCRIRFGGELSTMEEEIIDIGTPLAQWLGSSNSMWNPLIYGFLNPKFRRALTKVFRIGTTHQGGRTECQSPIVFMMIEQ